MGRVPAFFLLCLLAAAPARAATGAAADDGGSPLGDKRVFKAMLWSLLPGGGHFYLGDTGTGVTYAALTGALLASDGVVQNRNDKLGRKDETSIPGLAGEKVWEYSIFTTFRSAAQTQGYELRASHFDDTPTSKLLTAPFNPDQFLRPAVFGAALLGAAEGFAGSGDGSLRHVSRVHMMGSDFNRSDGTALYMTSVFSLSLGAGTAEEGLFRGILQPTLEERWGPTGGLWATAGTFGAAHAIGLDGKPNLVGVLAATGGGAYFGWLYDHDGYRLSGPIAAHFWYDFALFAANWIRDPNNNPLGIKVDFSF